MMKAQQFFKGFKKGVQYFGHNINLIVNFIFLTLVYLIGVGVTSIIAKLVGKHFLETKIDKKSKTYWSDLNLKKKKMADYYRQF